MVEFCLVLTTKVDKMISDVQIDPKNTMIAEATPSNNSLRKTTRLLFAIAVLGQWLFVYYIVALYGGIALSGEFERINDILAHGVIEGDRVGNAALAVHLALAAIIIFGGPLQFFKGLRRRFPTFHRWNGRIYFVTAFLISFAGLYMIYARGAHGGTLGAMGNTLNAILIMSFSVLAWRRAMQRRFDEHKKWALRAFLMVCGVWFFRIGYGLWLLLTGFTAPGMSADLTGPYDIFLMFGHSLVPLAILEFYFYAKAHPSPTFQKRSAAFFGLLCLLLVGGIGMLAFVFWLPLL